MKMCLGLWAEYKKKDEMLNGKPAPFFYIPCTPLCYDDYFINMTVKHNNLLNQIIGCLYVNFVGLPVSFIQMTIIRSVRAKEIVMHLCCMTISLSLTDLMMVI